MSSILCRNQFRVSRLHCHQIQIQRLILLRRNNRHMHNSFQSINAVIFRAATICNITAARLAAVIILRQRAQNLTVTKFVPGMKRARHQRCNLWVILHRYGNIKFHNPLGIPAQIFTTLRIRLEQIPFVSFRRPGQAAAAKTQCRNHNQKN
jgi:hypothetical protein